MKTKHIEKIIKAPAPHFVGDGFRVHSFIPGTVPSNRMNPFIILDYNSKYNFPPSEIPRGVGVHPHRGFETVTIAYKGRVEHGDSSGGGGVIGEGDVQWMTAASGVLHKEFHETEWSKKGGEFQMVQLWVNLPAKDKMGAPKYQALQNKDIPKISVDNQGSYVEVIAGHFQGQKGLASTFTTVNVLNAKLKSSTPITFDFPSHENTAMIVIQGKVKINKDQIAETDQFVYFKNEGNQFSVEALPENEGETILLILSGEPIDEPIVSYGPFVMNTTEEIQQALFDFNNGKFGHLE